LSLVIVLWGDLDVASDSIIDKFAQLILFFFNFVNQMFSIFNNKARFLNFFGEKIVLETFIFLFHLD